LWLVSKGWSVSARHHLRGMSVDKNGGMRILVVALTVQVALGAGFIALVASGELPFIGDSDDGGAPATGAEATVDRFDGPAAFTWLRRQVALGPRPAGSRASRRLAARLERALPRGRFQRLPSHPGLRNVIGAVPGSERARFVVVGAHYDTKDIPGFVGANDGASGTAVVVQLARTIRPRELRPTVVFILFDGEESPRGVPDAQFERYGLRGSKVAARRYGGAEAMILLDFVGDRDLSLPREGLSDRRLWAKLRAAAARAGVGEAFPAQVQGEILDDHLPFLRRGVPAIDLIDFDFPCFHRTCDDLSAVSERSVDNVGEAVLELLSRL
jgi:glutaminyl-peptide cyclotransferase